MKCAKRRYRDDIAAKLDLARIANVSKSAKSPQRAYLCPACHGWHLTSKR